MTRKRRITPHLFAQWERIARRIREKKRLVMFLDFDGTLVRIAPLPSSVRLEDGTRGVLQKLAGHRKVTLAVISGRQRAELLRHIGIPKMKYMGLYGWESDGKKRLPFPVRVALVRTLVELLAELPAYPGVDEPSRCRGCTTVDWRQRRGGPEIPRRPCHARSAADLLWG